MAESAINEFARAAAAAASDAWVTMSARSSLHRHGGSRPAAPPAGRGANDQNFSDVLRWLPLP